MGKSSPKPTPAVETSAAQTGSNVATSIANAFLQNVDEVTADGTKTFDQTDTYSYQDPYTGESYDIPRFTLTQTLSDAQQEIKDANDGASLNLANLGENLSGTLGQQLTGNFSLGNEETEARLLELGSTRLDPLFARRDEDLRTRLANQGIKAGSPAYLREMELAGQQENDAYNQLLLGGRAQASQELLAEDNQRINQISALLSGGQVSQPNFTTGTGVAGINATDNASIIANTDNSIANAWAQGQGATGSALTAAGGLFSLSDVRAKENIRKIATAENGLGIYSFRYKGQSKTEIGLMAQEVERFTPEAVQVRPDGLLEVDYGKALQ